jgi:hypothetical protein
MMQRYDWGLIATEHELRKEFGLKASHTVKCAPIAGKPQQRGGTSGAAWQLTEGRNTADQCGRLRDRAIGIATPFHNHAIRAPELAWRRGSTAALAESFLTDQLTPTVELHAC